MRLLSIRLVVSLGFLGSAASAAWTVDEMFRVKAVGDVQVSPDGRRVAFTVAGHVIGRETSEPRTELWVAAAEGSRASRFAWGSYPRWSPDGKSIAFLSNRSGETNIWRVHADGGEPEQLTHLKGGITGFKWSNNGTWLAFSAPLDNSAEEDLRRKEKTDWQVVDTDYRYQRLWLTRAEPEHHPSPAHATEALAGGRIRRRVYGLVAG